jgi:hypothetical protein
MTFLVVQPVYELLVAVEIHTARNLLDRIGEI